MSTLPSSPAVPLTGQHLPPRVLARKGEAAAWLGIGERTLDRLIVDGLPVLRPSDGLVLVDLRSALRWIRARGSEGAAA